MEKEFPFNLETQVQKENWLYPRKWFFLISLIFVVLGVISMFIPELRSFGEIIGGLGIFSLGIFLIYFWIINLIVMWRSKRYVYFWFSVFVRFIWVVFFFTNFYPYLKGKITIEELKGKEGQKMSKEEKAKIEYYQKHKEEIDKKENKEFISFLKIIGIVLGILIISYLISKLFF